MVADLLEFEQKFHNMDDTSKRCGLQALLPETMWQNRMAGQQYATFDALRKHVKDIVGDRTLTATKEKKTTNNASSHGGVAPMDIGQVEEGDQELYKSTEEATQRYILAMGYHGKGKGQSEWNQWGQPKGKGKGKDQKGAGSKGKGKAKGKGKEKPENRQCWTCGGWGHISAQCPNTANGKGVNEVGEEDQQQEGTTTNTQEAAAPEEEPAWLGYLGEWKTPSARKTFRQRNINNYQTNLDQVKTSGTFNLLQDADDYNMENDGRIMIATERKGNESWTKVSAIVDSGAVEHVLPEEWLPTAPMEASPGSKSGKKYLSATGQEIPNKGQKKIIRKTRESQSRGIVFQIAPVRKALISAAKMNDAGNDINLRGDRPHIMNVKTKQVIALRKEGKTYVFDLWTKSGEASGFTRRG